MNPIQFFSTLQEFLNRWSCRYDPVNDGDCYCRNSLLYLFKNSFFFNQTTKWCFLIELEVVGCSDERWKLCLHRNIRERSCTSARHSQSKSDTSNVSMGQMDEELFIRQEWLPMMMSLNHGNWCKRRPYHMKDHTMIVRSWESDGTETLSSVPLLCLKYYWSDLVYNLNFCIYDTVTVGSKCCARA